MHILHPFSLLAQKHHHTGLLNQGADFKGCIFMHISLCGWVTCSSAFICQYVFCVVVLRVLPSLLCVWLMPALFLSSLPSNYWWSKELFLASASESSQCDAEPGVLKMRGNWTPLVHTHTNTHKYTPIHAHKFYVPLLSAPREETVCSQPVVYSWDRFLFSI